MNKLLIFSAGQGGKELLFVIIEDINREKKCWDVLGFVDEKLFDSNKVNIIDNKKVNFYFLNDYKIYRINYFENPSEIYGICDVMDPKLKKYIVDEEIENTGFKLATLIHPSVLKPNDTEIGEGTIINPAVTINYNVVIGKSVKLQYNSFIAHDVTIGDYSFIGPSSTINGRCTIGKSCIIGSGAVLLDGVSVGENAVIGIGSVLTNNAKANSTYFGNPAKKIL